MNSLNYWYLNILCYWWCIFIFNIFCWSQVSLASDASLEEVASLTEGFTGADLAAILRDAKLAAVHKVLEDRNNGISDTQPCISKELLISTAREARPSTSAEQKMQYDMDFGQFVSSRKSVSTKVRFMLHFLAYKQCVFQLKIPIPHLIDAPFCRCLMFLAIRFLDSYWNISLQARESKGKKVTLAWVSLHWTSKATSSICCLHGS